MDLFHEAFSDVCITWRKGLRRVGSLPYNTHTVLLASLSESIHILDEIFRRTLSFTAWIGIVIRFRLFRDMRPILVAYFRKYVAV